MWSQRKTTVLENASLIRQNASTSYSSSVAGSLCTLYSRGCVPLNWSPRSLAVVAILGPPPPCCPGQTWPHPPTCLGPSNLSPGSPVLDPLHRFGPSPPPPPPIPSSGLWTPRRGLAPSAQFWTPYRGFGHFWIRPFPEVLSEVLSEVPPPVGIAQTSPEVCFETLPVPESLVVMAKSCQSQRKHPGAGGVLACLQEDMQSGDGQELPDSEEAPRRWGRCLQEDTQDSSWKEDMQDSSWLYDKCTKLDIDRKNSSAKYLVQLIKRSLWMART